MIKRLLKGGLILQLLFSCSNNKNNEEISSVTPAQDTTLIETTYNDESDYSLPSVVQMSSIFKKEGLKFNESFLNPTSNLKNYLFASSEIAALNLGIYSADLAYCLFNNQLDKGKDYFKSSRELANKLGLAQPFDKKGITQRIENNINRVDSMLYILANLQSDIDDIIQQENKEYFKTLIFCGGWLETQYIALNNILKQPEVYSLKQKQIEQLLILKDLLKILRHFETQEPSSTTIIQKFSTIENKVQNLPILNNLYFNSERIENEIPQDTLKKINFKELQSIISTTRNEFVNP
ncbi:MAG: hypothetical protein KatS3mg027_1213 [Bacteroidia bacterium]|nr:MAG: hypothetical protein KatS3mg027_1213 [Bacteroidia bacterium]